MEWRPGTAALPGLRSHDVFGTTNNFGMHGAAPTSTARCRSSWRSGNRDSGHISVPPVHAGMQVEPSPRVRRTEAVDPKAGEWRQAAYQHAIVADGHEPPEPAVFVSSCPRVSHSSLPDSRDRPTRRCFLVTRSHEETKRSCWVHPPAATRQASTGHSRTVYAGIRGDAPRLPPMASAAVGIGLGRESHAETRRYEQELCVSAGESTSCTWRPPIPP